MRRLLLAALAALCVCAEAYGQEEADAADAEVIKMLDLLETIEVLEDEDFELLENVTQMGDINDN